MVHCKQHSGPCKLVVHCQKVRPDPRNIKQTIVVPVVVPNSGPNGGPHSGPQQAVQRMVTRMVPIAVPTMVVMMVPSVVPNLVPSQVPPPAQQRSHDGPNNGPIIEVLKSIHLSPLEMHLRTVGLSGPHVLYLVPAALPLSPLNHVTLRPPPHDHPLANTIPLRDHHRQHPSLRHPRARLCF